MPDLIKRGAHAWCRLNLYSEVVKVKRLSGDVVPVLPLDEIALGGP